MGNLNGKTAPEEGWHDAADPHEARTKRPDHSPYSNRSDNDNDNDNDSDNNSKNANDNDNDRGIKVGKDEDEDEGEGSGSDPIEGKKQPNYQRETRSRTRSSQNSGVPQSATPVPAQRTKIGEKGKDLDTERFLNSNQYQLWIRGPISDDLTSVPGIGVKTVERLNTAGIRTTSMLIGKFMLEDRDEAKYQKWLEMVSVGRYAKRITKAVADKVALMCGGGQNIAQARGETEQ